MTVNPENGVIKMKKVSLCFFLLKNLGSSEYFLNFAPTRSCPLYGWVGYLLVKDVYGTLSLESSNLANLNPSSKDKATRTSTKGVLYQAHQILSCLLWSRHIVAFHFYNTS